MRRVIARFRAHGTSRRLGWLVALAVATALVPSCSAVGKPARVSEPAARTGALQQTYPAQAPEEVVGPPAPRPLAEAEGPFEVEGPPAPSDAPARQEAGPGGVAVFGPQADDAAPTRESRQAVRETVILMELERIGVDAHPSARGPVVVLPDTVFELGTATLQREARRKIHEIGQIVSERETGTHIAVEGHSDSTGAELYNRGLSERRAGAVAAELASSGVAQKLLTAKGYGSQFPIAPNERADGSDDPQGRARNRRVEIVIELGAPGT